MAYDAGSGPSEDQETARIREVFDSRDRTDQAGWKDAASRLLSDERMAHLERLVRRRVTAEWPSIVDVGCGGGHDLAAWLEKGWPPQVLAGIDLVERRVASARERCPGVDLRVGGGTELPFDSGQFDVATAATVFSSIRDVTSRRRLFAEMQRVVRDGGLVVVYDFVVRNPRNPDVVAMDGARIAELAGRPPDGSERLSPFLHSVGLGMRIHPRIGRLVARVSPPTHRLSFWRVGAATTPAGPLAGGTRTSDREI
jgi:ubiquinone/menaquinone biosynthesis C-methylase UbiE